MDISPQITPYESEQFTLIKSWKDEEPSVISKAINFVFKPVTWLVRVIVPQKAIEGALTLSDKLAQFLTDKDDVLRDGHVDSIEELRTKDLKVSDELANSVHNWALGIAATEGAATGAFGLPGIAIDIPALITMSLRVIHKIGVCYGYETKTKTDEQYVLGILSAAGSNTVKEKAAAVAMLQRINVLVGKMTWKNLAERAAANKYGPEAGILAIKTLAKQLGVNISKRKAVQAVPVIGAGVGAALNTSFLNDVAWTARRMYQERWLVENQKVFISSSEI